MQSLLRKKINKEDSPDDQEEWTPPSYAGLSEEEDKEWKPPSYAGAVETKPIESEHDKIKKDIKSKGFLKGLTDEFVRSIKDPIKSGVSEVITQSDDSREQIEPTTFWGGFGKSIKDQILGATVDNEALQSTARLRGRDRTETLGNIGNILLPSGIESAVAGARKVFGKSDKAIRAAEEIPIRQSVEKPYRAAGAAEDRPLNIKDKVEVKPPSKIFKSKDAATRHALNSGEETAKVVEHPSGSGHQVIFNKEVPRTVKEPVNPLADEVPVKKKLSNVDEFIKSVNDEKPTVGKLIKDPKEIATGEVLSPPAKKKPFINPFEKVKTQILDETSRPIAPAQKPIPTELQTEIPGTEFAQTVPEVRSAELPIKRDILRDYTGEKFNPDTYDNARDMFKMGKDLPKTSLKPSEWKPPDYAQMSDDATRMVEPSAMPREPQLVDKLPEGLEGDIKAPKLITEKPSSLSVDDTMEALNRLEKENPNVASLSEKEYDDLHARYLNDVKNEKIENPERKGFMDETGAITIQPKRKLKSEGPLGPVLDKLFEATLKAKENVVAQEGINKVERARRFAASAGVKKGGSAGAVQSLSKMKGEYDKVNPGERLQLNPKETDSLFDAIKSANITEGERTNARFSLYAILNGDRTPVRSELAILDDVFGNGFSSRITELHGGIGAVGVQLSKLNNTAKTLSSVFDLGVLTRQGGGMILRKEYYPAAKDFFKYLTNEDFYISSMKAIEEHPDYLLARGSGLYIPKSGTKAGKIQKVEEEFLNSYVTGLPVVRNFERASFGFLAKLRFDVFKSMAMRAKRLGNDLGTPDEPTKWTNAISNYINTTTRRGDLNLVKAYTGKETKFMDLNKMTEELNQLLWSPKNISAQVQMFSNPKLYMDLPKGMRLEGLKALLGVASIGITTSALTAAAGGKISSNILSSDFGKSRFGDNVVDPWQSFQQYVVVAARFLGGTDTDPTQSIGKTLGRFASNKLSPGASFAQMLAYAKKFTGKSDDPKTAGNFTSEYGEKTNVQMEVLKKFAPMMEEDLRELIASDPEWADHIGLTSALTGASSLGMLQNYPEKKKGFGKMSIR